MYHHTDSNHIHINWELRMRFLAALIWVFGISAMSSHIVVAACAAMAVAVMLPMGIGLKRVLKRLLIVAPFLLISYITLLISDGVPITREAFLFASLIALRIVASVLVVTLVTTDNIKHYLSAFKALRMPNAFTSTLFLTQRYVHLIGQQLSSVRNALVSRLFSPKMRFKTIQIYGQITGGVTVRAIDRSQRVQQAMFSRGFNGKMWTEEPAPILKTDVIKTVLAALFMAALLAVDIEVFR